MRVGIDASNIGMGGGITHLKEILNNFNGNDENSIKEIIVFSSKKVLNQLPDKTWLIKKSYSWLNKTLIHRLFFQLFLYDQEVSKYCDILFSITGDYIGKFKPMIGMSRNMLLYEKDIWKEINSHKETLRFRLNYLKQKRNFKNASGIIFISNYAKKFVNKVFDLENKSQILIHHGISPKFKGELKSQLSLDSYSFSNPFNFIYVSTVHVYKHQWNVVKAIGNLRDRGIPVKLTLVGGVIFEPAGELLEKTINDVDPGNEFISYLGHLPYDSIENEYRKADGIIFASTCENMPNILIESMASCLPIACSNKDPMPEFLKEGGFYFNAKSVSSIEESLINLLNSKEEREKKIKENLKQINEFSWQKTSLETFKFIKEIYQHV